MCVVLDVQHCAGQITGMLRRVVSSSVAVIALVTAIACGERNKSKPDSARALPPVYPGAPAGNPGWDPEAGPVMVVPLENSLDTVAVIVPEATDSTVSIVETMSAPVAGLSFDLFARNGEVSAAVRSVALPAADTSKQDCYGWPLARLLTRP